MAQRKRLTVSERVHARRLARVLYLRDPYAWWRYMLQECEPERFQDLFTHMLEHLESPDEIDIVTGKPKRTHNR